MTFSVPKFSCLRVLALAAMLASSGWAGAQTPSAGAKGYLGAYARSNSNVLQTENAMEGITVTKVVENSPAEAAGLQEEDVILQANGQGMEDPNELYDLVETLPIGAQVVLRIERDREVMDLEARTVERLPPPEGLKDKNGKTWIENARLGLEFRTPDPERNRALNLAPREGIEVVRLARRSPLQKKGIEPGMVIAETDGATIHSPEDFLDRVGSSKEKSSMRLRYATPEGRWDTANIRLHGGEKEVRKLRIPLIVNYARDPKKTTLSIPLLLFKRERIEDTIRYRWLWLFNFERGRSDELLQVEPQ